MTDDRQKIPSPSKNSRTTTALSKERDSADETLEMERFALDTAVREMDENTRFPRDDVRNYIRQLSDRLQAQRAAADKHRNLQREQTNEALAYETLSSAKAQSEAAQSTNSELANYSEGLSLILTELSAIATAADRIRAASFARADDDQYAEEIQASIHRILAIAGDLLDPADSRGVDDDPGDQG